MAWAQRRSSPFRRSAQGPRRYRPWLRPTCRACTSAPSEGLLSSTIFTGTRWTTLVKFPVALSGGSSAKVLPCPRRPTVHVASELEVGKGVDRHAGRLADPDVGHLRFLEVRERPDVRQRKDGDHLRADIDELAEAHLPLADEAVGGRQNSRIAQIVRGERDLRFRRVDLGAKLLLLNVDRRQRRLLLVELGFVQAPLRDRFLRIVVGLFDQLLGAGDSGLEQVALALDPRADSAARRPRSRRSSPQPPGQAPAGWRAGSRDWRAWPRPRRDWLEPGQVGPGSRTDR